MKKQTRFADIEQSSNRSPALGRCIYCGTTEGKLTEEHIFPYFLGGRSILPEASCDSCQKITSFIELRCARSIFSDFRHHHRMKSRNKGKSRPSTIPVVIHGLQGTRTERVPFDSAPPFLILPEFDQPDIFANRGSTHEVIPRSMYHWTTADMAERAAKFLRPGDYSWELVRQADWALFCRMLAKIVLASLASITDYPTHKSLLAAVVLGKDRFIRRYIGGKTDLMIPRQPNSGPAMLAFTCRTNFDFSTNSVSGRRLLFADIALLKEIEGPEYRLIVGDVQTDDLTTIARAGITMKVPD